MTWGCGGRPDSPNGTSNNRLFKPEALYWSRFAWSTFKET